MIYLEMQNAKSKRSAPTAFELEQIERVVEASEFERTFACQLATSAWLRQLGDEEARVALSAYVKARCRNRLTQACLQAVLESEYALCRERLDLCS